MQDISIIRTHLSCYEWTRFQCLQESCLQLQNNAALQGGKYPHQPTRVFLLHILICGYCLMHHFPRFHRKNQSSQFQEHTPSYYNTGGGIRPFSLPNIHRAREAGTPNSGKKKGLSDGCSRVRREEIEGPASVE